MIAFMRGSGHRFSITRLRAARVGCAVAPRMRVRRLVCRQSDAVEELSRRQPLLLSEQQM
jgi:hypothetical protein